MIEKKLVVIKATKYFISLIVVIVAIELIIFNIANKRNIDTFIQEQSEHLQHDATNIGVTLDLISTDLKYLTETKLTKNAIIHKSDISKNELIQLIAIMHRNKNDYDQIRILDTLGNEVIRVDNKRGKIQVIPDTLLQNKANRYYFKETMKLDSNDMYVSPFDLNIEHGKIEQPLNPMIRYSKKVVDSSGNTIAVGILNFRGNSIIESIINNHNDNKEYLVNADGYFIVSPKNCKPWGWMYEDRADCKIQNIQPRLWAQMSTLNFGYIQSTNGIYVFQKTSTMPKSVISSKYTHYLYIIKHINRNTINSIKWRTVSLLLLSFILIIPVQLFISIRLAIYKVTQRKLLQKLEQQARHDELTGLYNRRELVYKLNKDMKMAWRRKAPLSIIFIDLNNLKVVNDNLGHQAGDNLICGLSDAIKVSLRETDYAARVGGDEFIVVLPDCKRQDAYEIVNRITKILKENGEKVNQEWSMSCGIAELRVEDNAEELIERADTRMYENKVKQKKSRGEQVR